MTNITTGRARATLRQRREPYWHRVSEGRYLGFRVNAAGPGTWICRWRDDTTLGQRYHSLGALDHLPENERFNAAVKAAQELFDHLDQGGTPEAGTVANACQLYLDDLRRRKGQKAADDVGRRFKQYVLDHPLAKLELTKLKQHQVERWRDDLHDTPTQRGEARTLSSLNRDMTCLRSALNFAFRKKLATSNAAWAEALKPIPKADNSRTDYLDRSQRLALVAAAAPDISDFMTALCAVPLRPGALAALRVGDYDARLRTIHVKDDKANAKRHVKLPDEVAALFDRAAKHKLRTAYLFTRADGAKWVKDKWGCPVRAAVEAAKLPPEITLYVLRHSTITDLVHAGVDLLTVAQISGTSLRMIEQVYGHLRPNVAVAALAKVAL